MSLLAACSSGSDRSSAPEVSVRTADGKPIEVAIASVNDELGVPSFLWLSGGDLPEGALSIERPETVATKTLRAIAKHYRLTESGLNTVQLGAVHDVGEGALVVRFTQRVREVEIFRGGLNLALSRNLRPIAATGSLSSQIVPKAGGRFVLPLDGAVAKAVSEATGRAIVAANVAPANVRASDSDYSLFDVEVPALGGVSRGLATHPRAKRVFYPTKTALLAGYYVEVNRLIGDGTDSELMSYVVSADDGRILFQNRMSAADSFTYRVWADPVTFAPLPGPQGHASMPYPLATPQGLRPTWVQPSRVALANAPYSKNDPWLPPGATETIGNNVDAYADLAAPDGFGAGDVRPNITSLGAFDRTFQTAENPDSNDDAKKAITTHLFYVVNYLHDYFYDAGFDEKSGNAQTDNLGRGGKAGDPVLAEAQDFSGRSNANMSTPADGQSPRMQMYIFDGPPKAKITVGATDYPASVAQFTAKTFSLSGDAVLVNDGTGTATDACETPFANAAAVAGKIAVVDRGTCSFVQKVQNATTAGARGVIVINNTGTTPPQIGASGDAAITIPILGMALPDGNALKAALGGTTPVAAKLTREKTLDRDGALDAGIVSHEWGHYISNRLIGDGNGITTVQGGGMGEGWGDFIALLTIVSERDAGAARNVGWAGTFGAGGYVLGDQGQGESYYFGVRRYPYSTDLSKNPLTFKHITNGQALPVGPPVAFGEDGAKNAEVHNAGEVWGAMLWECYAALLRDTKYSFQQANVRMRRYLVASFKLTPIAPTFIDARDALLAAAYASDAYDFKLFADAFAKRGAGTGAKAPDRAAADNAGVSESFVAGNDVEIVSATLTDSVVSCDKDGILDNGETGLLTVQLRNAGIGTLDRTTVNVTASLGGISFPDGASVRAGSIKPYDSAKVTLPVKLEKGRDAEDFELLVALEDPTLAQPRTVKTTLQATANLDFQPASARVDNVEAPSTTWTTGGDKALDTTLPWTRKLEGRNHSWFVPANQSTSDQYLVSPVLEISASDSFKIAFSHRHSFEVNNAKYFDGAVLEISVDDGATWKDIGDSLYTGSLETDQSDNPLKGRKAFVGKSEGYPAFAKASIDLGKEYSGKKARVRFRSGSDAGTAFVGWELDDIEFQGIQNTPFASVVPNTCHFDGASSSGSNPPTGDGTTSDTQPTEPGTAHAAASGNGGGCSSVPTKSNGALFLGGLGTAALLGARRRKRRFGR